MLGVGSGGVDSLPSHLHQLIVSEIRQRGPLTVPAYMELALYHPVHGYYTSNSRRSGRDGDFFTSVDVGSLFGEVLAIQLADVWQALRAAGAREFQLVECGAGDGRLARDVLDAAERTHPDLYEALHVFLCDRSAPAAEAQRANVARHASRVTTGCAGIPRGVTGAIVANELLDALPVHRVVKRRDTLHELHVAETNGRLYEVPLQPSTARLQEYLSTIPVQLPEGAIAEIGLAAVDWVTDAANATSAGAVLLFDYGAEAFHLFSPRHAAGTLMSYRDHLPNARWLEAPGERDITSHVNLTAIDMAAALAGLKKHGTVDQTYFVINLGITEVVDSASSVAALRRRLAARTLLMPGGLGSTIKALAYSKNLSTELRGVASGRIA